MLPIVVVGAGPAGMMLAYQLASNGVAVRVLERHKDFDRELRGELAQPSLVDSLDTLGILEPLRRDGRVMPIRAVRMHFRAHAFASNVGHGGSAVGQAIHQPSLLQAFNHEEFRSELSLPRPSARAPDARAAGATWHPRC